MKFKNVEIDDKFVEEFVKKPQHEQMKLASEMSVEQRMAMTTLLFSHVSKLTKTYISKGEEN